MTPDIREKAERLALRIDAEASRPGIRGIAYMDLSVTADLLSQAILDAQNAGKAEERERTWAALARVGKAISDDDAIRSNK